MQVIDLRGVSCPATLSKPCWLWKILITARPLDDGEPVKNLPRSLKADGHRLIGLKQAEEGHYVLELEKFEE